MMSMPRNVAAETLDGLAEDDPAAMRSRRDLQRIHRLMGTRAIMTRSLQRLLASRPSAAPLRLLELGAGDGSLMLGVAGALGARCPAVEITLLDRQDLVSRSTLDDYARLGWTASAHVVDVFDWASPQSPAVREPSARWDVIVANLFLHHFEGPELATLLAAIESRARRFLACEPRRAGLALAGSYLVGVIGANAVTRQDAVLSVHAGFRDQELSALWPGDRSFWTVSESSAGLFSHCFLAERSGLGGAEALP
ncbi:MAG: methyltransferase domain-containing protein [Polaromonas sp.]